jgi:hypothetical protein
VLTRQTTSPHAPRVLVKGRHGPLRNTVQPRSALAVSSLTLTQQPTENSPISFQHSSHGITPPELPSAASQPLRNRRKTLPRSWTQHVVKDPLVDRFEKLRLPVRQEEEHAEPLAPASTPRSTTNFSFPLSSDDSTAAAKHAWNKMAVSHPRLPTFREQPMSHLNHHGDTNHFRQAPKSTRPIIMDGTGDEDVTVISERPASNFSDTNFFQSGHHQPSYQQRQSRVDKLLRKTSVRRSRSPSVASSDSEGDLTPDSSEDSHSDLTARVAQATSRSQAQAITLQEEQDHQFAERMQQEEGGTSQSLFFERLRSGGPKVASSDLVPRRPHRRRRSTPITSLKRAIARSGTRDDPISLDSESDESSEIRGEPMELDEMSTRTSRQPQSAGNYEKYEHPRNRDCVVCGESVHIADLPALFPCDHRPETCAECYSGWITARLQDSNWGEVKCPGDGCKTILSYHDIQAYGSPEIFQRYDTYIARAAFSQDRESGKSESLQAPLLLTSLAANFRWCRACDSGQIHLSGVEGNIFTCVACGHKVCIVHENTWHEGETCEEFEYRASGRKERDRTRPRCANCI